VAALLARAVLTVGVTGYITGFTFHTHSRLPTILPLASLIHRYFLARAFKPSQPILFGRLGYTVGKGSRHFFLSIHNSLPSLLPLLTYRVTHRISPLWFCHAKKFAFPLPVHCSRFCYLPFACYCPSPTLTSDIFAILSPHFFSIKRTRRHCAAGQHTRLRDSTDNIFERWGHLPISLAYGDKQTYLWLKHLIAVTFSGGNLVPPLGHTTPPPHTPLPPHTFSMHDAAPLPHFAPFARASQNMHSARFWRCRHITRIWTLAQTPVALRRAAPRRPTPGPPYHTTTAPHCTAGHDYAHAYGAERKRLKTVGCRFAGLATC